MKKSVTIEAYQPVWTDQFGKLAEVLAAALDDGFLAIEHVGSTSVKDLCAKPILDIDIVVADAKALPGTIQKLSRLGYAHEGDLGIKGREAFKLENQSLLFLETGEVMMEHHLYVCPAESEELERHLVFRDFLRRNPAAATEYGKLKRKLAELAGTRKAYTDGKNEFIHFVLAGATSEEVIRKFSDEDADNGLDLMI